jgi:transposase
LKCPMSKYDNHSHRARKGIRLLKASKVEAGTGTGGALMGNDIALYGGLDLHGNNVFCTLMDAARNVRFEKRFPNDMLAIREGLEPFRKWIKELAVESTFNWYWLVDGLAKLKYRVRLANPAKMQENIGLKHANDKTDARFIARQLVNGILPEGYIYPEETRGIRDMLRRRMHLVQDRTTESQRLTALVARQTGRDMTADEILKSDMAEVLGGQREAIAMAEASRRHIDFLSAEIKALEKTATELLPDKAAYKHLMTAPGIGLVLARCILMETGPVARFKKAGNYASYCRAVSTEHTSNDKKKGEGNSKCGNRYLAWAFVEAANMAARYSPEINAWFQRKTARSGGKRVIAVKALANKMAKACYFMLRDGTDFDVAKIVGGKAK